MATKTVKKKTGKADTKHFLRTFTKTEAKQMASAYKRGASIGELCVRFDASYPVIRRTIVAQRVKIRKRGRVAGE